MEDDIEKLIKLGADQDSAEKDKLSKRLMSRDLFAASESVLPGTKHLLEGNSAIRQVLERSEESERMMRASIGRLDFGREFGVKDATLRFLEDIERQGQLGGQYEKMIRAAAGPMAELLRAQEFDRNSPLMRIHEQTLHSITEWESRFRLPDFTEAVRLVTDFQAKPMVQAMQRYADQALNLQRAVEKMRVPWLDEMQSQRSIAGFAGLQNIGYGLAHLPAFGESLASALRMDLGDWRESITWPNEIFTDLGARSDFYQKLGFDGALTDFPYQAFQESMKIADLRREPPPLVARYGPPVQASSDDAEEQSLARTTMAHSWLLRLETQIRRFIHAQMTDAFGRDWAKHRLPNGLYDKWKAKKEEAQKNGAKEWDLIAYADFTEYEVVICKRDNWNIFAPYFNRPENVRESFQRLHPIRLDTMHARPITLDDELLLYVEVRRLTKAMKKKKQ
jgi:hypothetical protein